MSENMEEEAKDFISPLPDSLLSAILSRLPSAESVRTCVLSKRWKTAWKQVSWLTFDERLMLKELIEGYVSRTSLSTRLLAALSRKFVPYGENDEKDAIFMAETLINAVLDSHATALESCSIRHMPESCASGEAINWMKKLLYNNKVKRLLMEREWPKWSEEGNLHRALKNLASTLDLPFEVLTGFEALEIRNYYLKTPPSADVSANILTTFILNNINIETPMLQGILDCCLSLESLTIDRCTYMKDAPRMKIQSPRLKFFRVGNMSLNLIEVSAPNLEVFEVDTVICHPEKLIFDTPKLRILHSYFDGKYGYHCYLSVDIIKLLTSREVLDTCRALQNPAEGPPPSFAHIFKNLVSLHIDLDMKKVLNAVSLFTALKSCPMLQYLKINSQLNNDASDHFNSLGIEDPKEDDILPYPKVLYWKNREPCECIEHKLKNVRIVGYFGMPFEVEFLKYIITTAEALETLTVWFVDDCPWAQATETLCLLSFPKASPNLSIVLHPGPVYMANVDGSFEDWVSSLRE